MKLLKAIVGLAVAIIIASPGATPAMAASTCNPGASSSTICFLAENDSGSTYYGHAGDVYRCPLIYFGVKINDGYDSINSIEFSGVGADGVLVPGTTVFANLRLDQECISWSGAYDIALTLKGLSNQSLVGQLVNEEFTYRKKYSSRIDSYCFTEVCGFTFYTFKFDIPEDYKRDLVSVRADVVGMTQFQSGMLADKFTYTEAFSIGPRLLKPSQARIDFSMVEVDGRIMCFTTDASDSAVSQFGIEGFDFEIVRYSGPKEVLLDAGSWAIGIPPNNIKVENLKNGESSSAVVNNLVYHTYRFTQENWGEQYGCKMRARTVLGPAAWNVKKLKATQSVVGGISQGTPSNKEMCSALNRKYPGGVAKTSKVINKGAKTHKSPFISEAIYKANIKLDTDNDGIACER